MVLRSSPHPSADSLTSFTTFLSMLRLQPALFAAEFGLAVPPPLVSKSYSSPESLSSAQSTGKGLLAITGFPNNPERFSVTRALYTFSLRCCSSSEWNLRTTGTCWPPWGRSRGNVLVRQPVTSAVTDTFVFNEEPGKSWDALGNMNCNNALFSPCLFRWS